MSHEASPFDESEDLPVTGQTMRLMALSKLDDDYYLGGGVHEDRVDSDDEMSSDDEVKSHLKKLAGIDDKKTEKDAFGRKRRKSEFEDEMDDLLDRSISEYASDNMRSLGLGDPLFESKLAIDDAKEDEEMRKIDENARKEFENAERQMSSLEMLPYDLDLTDSEVDPEMPAAVIKDDRGVPIKLVYSHKNGTEFDVEERRRRQRERRHRAAKKKPSEAERRKNLIKSVAESFKQASTSDPAEGPSEKPFVDRSKPLKSILKKPEPATDKVEEMETDETKHVTLETGNKEENEDEDDNNPIKKAARDRLKEVEKNDDLFYDDEEDDDNERWVRAKRRRSRGEEPLQPVSTSGRTKEDLNIERKPKLDNDSDAVLSCPGCMTELTSDCQRHEIYKDQYRAMFVSNCTLDEQKVTVEKTGKDKRKQKKTKGTGVSAPVNSDIFTPVKCSVCSTAVAMMDSDEVYHFFNVLSGYA